MLDQSFTTENFRKIFDYENRKGVYLEGKFFPDVEQVTQDIKKCSTKVRDLYKKKDSIDCTDFEKERTKFYEEKNKLRDKKEELLIKELEKISSDVTNGEFQIEVQKINTPNGKQAYTVQNDPRAYFTIKQIQSNVRKLYKIKQNNRYEILCQLKGFLKNSFPKYIIRTDIKKFYESISQRKLIKKIDEDPLLTLSSKKIIKMILQRYKTLSGNAEGVPRGIGISAYLAELYMRSFDSAIKAHPEVTFYSRYVDDIVVIFTPKITSSTSSFLSFIIKEAKELELEINVDKTLEQDALSPKEYSLDYLGYSFKYGIGDVDINISDTKKSRYKNRISNAFGLYKKQSYTNEKKARKVLVKRIQFLTSNTRLYNSKGMVLVGIFYSNSLISHSKHLSCYDDCLRTQIDDLSSESLKQRLRKYSFVEGFERKKFIRFKTSELSQITELWKYEK